VIAARVMKVAADAVVSVIVLRNRIMAATRPMLMRMLLTISQ